MFAHNFKYTLKSLVRNKALIFWTFAFPLVLATFYNMAFSNIEKSEKFSSIDIAIIDDDAFNNSEIYKEAFKSLSSGEDKVFNITYTDINNSKKLLSDGKITGYLKIEDNKTLITVSKNGENETIFKLVVDEINSKKDMYETLMNKEIEDEYKNGNYNIDYSSIYKSVNDKINSGSAKLNNITSSNISYTVIEFYNLIAMAALYGGIISMSVINKKLANMDSVGKRTSISPIKKGDMLFESLLASYIVELIGLALLLIYMIFVIKIDFGTHLPLVLLLVVMSSLAGLTLGIFIATILKTHENAKTGILISITMIWCFLAGMTGMVLKYVIDKNIPILNIINPASMITDGFYSLYYYTNLNRYWFDIISLAIFSIVMIFVSLKGLRRQKYDSI